MAFIVTDDFNRTDANPIGGNWTTVTGQGAMQLVSNTMAPASTAADSAAYWNAAYFSDNQYAQCKVTVTGTTSQTGIGPMVRASTSAQTFYRVVVSKNATNVALGKVVAGAFTSLWTRTATFTDGDTVRLEANGTTLRVLINGVAVGADTTDSSITGGRPGVIYSSASTSASVDDWEAGNLNGCPALIGVGAAASGTNAAQTAAFPTGYSAVTNDIGVVYQECEGTDTPTAPSGWSIITTSTVASGTTTKLTAFWRRFVAGDTAPSFTSPGNHQTVRMAVFRGCAREGDPFDFFLQTQELTSDTTVSITAGTTTFAETLCLAAFSTGQDVASTAGATAWADSSLISIEEIMDNWTTQGLGGGFAVAKGEMLTAGSINNTTATLSLTANFKAHIFVAIKPDTVPPILIQRR